MKKLNSAVAYLQGSPQYPNIRGTATFKNTCNGVLLTIEICGLPTSSQECNEKFFALHIHDGESCIGTPEDPFANAGTHLNPQNCEHPSHAGDLPPLFGNNGYAYMSVYTERFSIEEIIGKVLIIHDKPDDFQTQPSGNSGVKIACAEIIPLTHQL